MAGTRRLDWLAARVAEVRPETGAARTIVFDVPGWPATSPGNMWTSS